MSVSFGATNFEFSLRDTIVHKWCLLLFAKELGLTEEQALKLGGCFGGGMCKGEVKGFKGKFHCENTLFIQELMVAELDKIFDT